MNIQIKKNVEGIRETSQYHTAITEHSTQHIT